MCQEKSKKQPAKKKSAYEYFFKIEDSSTGDYVVFYGNYESEDRPVKQRMAFTPAMSHIDAKSMREALNIAMQMPGVMISSEAFRKDDMDISERFSRYMKAFHKRKDA